jgi:hypothetical protein
MMYIFSFFSFWGLVFRPAILYLHGLYRHIIVHMTLVVYGQYLWLCIYGFVYGYVFMDVGLWVRMGAFLDVWLCFLLCVYGYGYVFVAMCMGIGSRSSARPGSINIGAYLSLGPVSANPGTYSFSKFWDLLLHEAHFSNFWDLLLREAHFYPHNLWDLLLHEAHLDDSSNFSNFSPTKMEKFAPVCSVE